LQLAVALALPGELPQQVAELPLTAVKLVLVPLAAAAAMEAVLQVEQLYIALLLEVGLLEMALVLETRAVE
jgi:hypothetical protein